MSSRGVLVTCFSVVALAVRITSNVSKIIFNRFFLLRRSPLPSWTLPFEIYVKVAGLFCDQITGKKPRFAPTIPRPPYLWRRVSYRVLPGCTDEEHRPAKHTKVTDPKEIARLMREEGLLLYFHGGGYTTLSPRQYRTVVGEILVVSGGWAIVPDYPLAPEHPYPSALNYVISVYEKLLKSGVPGTSITVAGDSAGGNLSLAFTLKLKQMGLPLPRKIALLSPWVDLTGSPRDTFVSNASYDFLDPKSIAHVGKMYAASALKTNPLISPIFADFTGEFPPVLLQFGEAEIFASEDRELAAKMIRDGVELQSEEASDMIHVYQLASLFFKPAEEAVTRIGEFIKIK